MFDETKFDELKEAFDNYVKANEAKHEEHNETFEVKRERIANVEDEIMNLKEMRSKDDPVSKIE